MAWHRADFKSIWVIDFEYTRPDDSSDPPHVVCMVAVDLLSGRKLRVFREELSRMRAPPFDIGEDTLFVGYAVGAEGACFAALNWPLPARVLDPYVEHLLHRNGRRRHVGDSTLLFAMGHYGLSAMAIDRKEEMRELIMAGGPWGDTEQQDILDYCEEDAAATARLLDAMDARQHLDWPRAIWRGVYSFATGYVEHQGIPLDAQLYRRVLANWPTLRQRLINRVDADYQVYVDGSFNMRRFAGFLTQNGIPWPRLPTGTLALDGQTFADQAEAFPGIEPLRQLRLSLDKMRSPGLAVGNDNANRFWWAPFRSKTGRNQPSTALNILSAAAWARGFVTPPKGEALVIIDWTAQEVAIAAGRSGDFRMRRAYATTDVHMACAVDAGLAPVGATEETHPLARARAKVIVLGASYGITAHGVSRQLGIAKISSQALLDAHRATYAQFWRWIDGVVGTAMFTSSITAPMGWHLAINDLSGRRAVQNFMMQASGAEMLRAAVVRMVWAGLRVCGMAHDAIMLRVSLDRLTQDQALAEEIMQRTSLSFTDGLLVRTKSITLLPGERWLDKKGQPHWDLVMGLLEEEEATASLSFPFDTVIHTEQTEVSHGRTEALLRA